MGESGDDVLGRERRLRAEREQASGVRRRPPVLTRELPQLPDGGGWLRIDVIPARGIAPDEHWVAALPACARLRLTRRWETRFVHPIPDRWHEMPAEWLARMWEGAEPP